jgi:hypothetical protein
MRKTLFLVPALLLAGCRGEQVVFQFQSAPATSVAMAPTLPVTNSSAALSTLAVAPASAPVAASPKPVVQLRPRRLVANSFSVNALTTLATPKLTNQKLSQHLRRRHTTEGVAESGLGRVALFFIAVTLGVLAGLAALVNLIFSVGFFTALGYTAAGLVVLFLLYSLLSGGKKK